MPHNLCRTGAGFLTVTGQPLAHLVHGGSPAPPPPPGTVVNTSPAAQNRPPPPQPPPVLPSCPSHCRFCDLCFRAAWRRHTVPPEDGTKSHLASTVSGFEGFQQIAPALHPQRRFGKHLHPPQLVAHGRRRCLRGQRVPQHRNTPHGRRRSPPPALSAPDLHSTKWDLQTFTCKTEHYRQTAHRHRPTSTALAPCDPVHGMCPSAHSLGLQMQWRPVSDQNCGERSACAGVPLADPRPGPQQDLRHTSCTAWAPWSMAYRKGGGGGGTRPWCWLVCRWQRLLASRHCTVRPSEGLNVVWLCHRSPWMTCDLVTRMTEGGGGG